MRKSMNVTLEVHRTFTTSSTKVIIAFYYTVYHHHQPYLNSGGKYNNARDLGALFSQSKYKIPFVQKFEALAKVNTFS